LLHLDYLKENNTHYSGTFIKKASGRYYTGDTVGKRLARLVARNIKIPSHTQEQIKIVDPFSGDGRLIVWFLDSWLKLNCSNVLFDIELWDIDTVGFKTAQENINKAGKGIRNLSISCKKLDSFQEALKHERSFDIVLTNPPWEVLKPDRREIDKLPTDTRERYISKMREYDNWLASNYPLSQPKRKFAGWGTNLSRVGLELCLKLLRSDGILGSVLPASIFADDQSTKLRKHLLTKHSVIDIAYYSAEAKLYEKADVPSVTIVAKTDGIPKSQFPCTLTVKRIIRNQQLYH
jgi:Alw26I/Eco31I/Esp3I family type II restriction m6 adenine DNA methyltransferase